MQDVDGYFPAKVVGVDPATDLAVLLAYQDAKRDSAGSVASATPTRRR